MENSTILQEMESLPPEAQKQVLDAEEVEELDCYEEIDDYLSFLNRIVRNLLHTQRQ